jgi:thiamine pyrophosphate-dependent acetolactate synthase large subunit-like protein
MKDHNSTWSRLTALARRAPADEIGTPPLGFSTRVVARAFETRRKPDELMVSYALRALGFAGALAVVCAVTNLNVLSADTLAADLTDDPVGEFITQL